MNENFLRAVAVTIHNEGGYSVDPRDSGGETYKGISRKYEPKWLGWKIIDKYKKANKNFPDCLDDDTELKTLVNEVYYEKYWVEAGCDKLTHENMQDQLFDSAVNCGVKTAIKMIQESMGIKPVDGIMGKMTISRLNSLS